MIADDGPSATAGQALSKWLDTPTKDGKPKQLSCCALSEYRNIKWINCLKKAFLRATTSSPSYIILLADFKSTKIGPFELMNERTNEMLTLEIEVDYEDMDEEYENEYGYPDEVWQVKRCQIGETIQWEDENSDNLNNVGFTCSSSTNCIWPLSPPKAGQINAKNSSEMSAGPSGQ